MSARSTFQFLKDSHITFYSSDDLVQLCVDYLKEYPLLVGSGLACPVIFTPPQLRLGLAFYTSCVFSQILLLLAFLWLMKGEEERPRRSKKDKKEKREAK